MKICHFTQGELDLFRKECNFTDIESRCFELKAKDCTDVQLASELNIAESTVAVTMRRVRSKIDTVLKRNVRKLEEQSNDGCMRKCIISHTMSEWARIPDFLSSKGVMYIYSDYRTENNVNIPRIKLGDGINSVSELPFATMSITDDDMEYWDNKPDTKSNDFGKIVQITDNLPDVFTFPTDGYMMLEFNTADDFAEVKIYGASEQSYFIFEKRPRIDIHSKEVFVKKGMKCEFVSCSKGGKIKFVPLV